ncbi:MAG: tRNA adenosine(34) deaminase TadA [Actinomycetes bacterium]
MLSDLQAMAIALEEATQAGQAGEVPVGAVAILHGEVIARAGNRRERDHDPNAHAEVLVLREAARQLGNWRLDEVTVVVTLEPCAMCAGAMLNARLGRLVYGASDEKAGAVGSRYQLLSDPRLNHEVPSTVGVMAEASAALLKSFFADRR